MYANRLGRQPERHILQSVHQTGLDPLVAPATQRSSRARPISDSPVGAAKDQYFNLLLEDHAVGYAGPVAAERMIHFSFRQQGAKLLPDRLDDVWLDGGHGNTLLHIGKLR